MILEHAAVIWLKSACEDKELREGEITHIVPKRKSRKGIRPGHRLRKIKRLGNIKKPKWLSVCVSQFV